MSGDMVRLITLNLILGLLLTSMMGIAFVFKIPCVNFDHLTRHMTCF